MDYTADERAMLWLCACTDLTDRERAAALRRAGSPAALFQGAEEILPALLKEARSYRKTRAARAEETEAFLARLFRQKQFFVTPLSEDYPEALRFISLPPLILFGMGRRELLKTEKFCVVGSRITPPWAAALGTRITEEVARRFTIVTGLAEGGDRAAAEGAMKSGNLISVLPCGLNECYPAAHADFKAKIAECGLLLSELLPDDAAKKYSFHARNRLLAGLARGTLVISAGEKSGALITAGCALDAGRDVFAFPYNAGAAQGAGCNGLLKKGAYVVTEADDILSVYGFEAEKKRNAALSPEEARLYALLKEMGETHTMAFAEAAGLQAHEVLAILSSLEMKGLAVRSGGNRYEAI